MRTRSILPLQSPRFGAGFPATISPKHVWKYPSAAPNRKHPMATAANGWFKSHGGRE